MCYNAHIKQTGKMGVADMPTNEQFFETPSEQSQVKAKIVVDYFSAWSRVIRDHWDSTIPIGYIDLFCGPGTYKDGTKSVPLLLIEKVLNDPRLSRRMMFSFNDEDENNIACLKQAISCVPNIATISASIQYSSKTIDASFGHNVTVAPNIPILSFVDPFGYKGITKELISKLIESNGSDCIFFFNYNRINMALSSNTKFDEYLEGIFGQERTAELRQKLLPLTPAEREPVVLNALMGALKEESGRYALPFKFYSKEMRRTSHFIIFVSKHRQGLKIMKEIMYANSAKDIDGVATFEFKDSYNFNSDFEQLCIFNRPLQSLCEDLYNKNKGKQKTVKELYDPFVYDVSNYFVAKNVKDALKRLEAENRLVVISGRKRKYVKNEITMPDAAVVKFV